jgi:hypothetical protein
MPLKLYVWTAASAEESTAKNKPSVAAKKVRLNMMMVLFR